MQSLPGDDGEEMPFMQFSASSKIFSVNLTTPTRAERFALNKKVNAFWLVYISHFLAFKIFIN